MLKGDIATTENQVLNFLETAGRFVYLSVGRKQSADR